MQQGISATVRWGDWIGEGWQMFAERWQVWVVQALIMFVVFAIPGLPFYAMMFTIQIQAAQTGEPPDFPVLFFPMLLAVMVVWLLAAAFFMSGLYQTAFKQLRGEPISVRDIFSGGNRFLRVVGASITIYLLTMLIAFLCLVPAFLIAWVFSAPLAGIGLGIIGALLYFLLSVVTLGSFHFTIPLIIERDLSIGEALRTSYNSVKPNRFMVSLFIFVVYMLASAGFIACYIGVLASYPLLFTITVISYRDLFGVAGARRFSANQQQYPTNYSGPSWASSGSVPPPPPQFNAFPDEQATLTICSNCGTQMNRGARFCNKCGSPLNAG